MQVKKVFYVNSYHPGYPASDSVAVAIQTSLSSAVKLQTFYLDAKHLSNSAVDSMAQLAWQAILKFKPDVVIASDDDAVKKLAVPYLKNTATPVVFCGVNWSAAAYGLPAKNVTGMLEVLPLVNTLQTVRSYFPGSKKLVVLSENSFSEQKNREVLDTVYRNQGLLAEYQLVADFAAWKKVFLEANERADIIYLSTNGAIAGWKEEEAKAFVSTHIKKPVITCDDFMMPYAVVGFTKIAKEQGEWAAQTALRIIHGERPSAIPVAANVQQQGWWNVALAAKLHWIPDSALLQRVQLVQ